MCIYSCNFGPGSYPYAERYYLKINESDLINHIEEFKKCNPEYCVPDKVELPDGSKVKLDDGRRDISNGQNIMSYLLPKLFSTFDKRSLRF